MNIRVVSSFIIWLVCYPLIAATLESVDVRVEPTKTSVIFMGYGDHSKRTMTKKIFLLTNPYRVVVDFENTTTRLNVSRLDLHNGLITGIRSGHPTPNKLRLVFDLSDAVRFNSSSWVSANLSQKGLRVDIMSESLVKPGLKKASKAQIPQRSKNQAHVQRPPSNSQRDVIVVIDPGHGGKDPGAIGPRRHAEKNAVLAIALKLKNQIDKQPGMHAVLTRQGDYYVGLRDRLTMARNDNADIFISIHADAFIQQDSSGASVFALSPRGATSEAARWLAEKENYSELGGVNLSGLHDQNGMIRSVLLDLSQTATISASLEMGTQVLHHLGQVTRLHNRKVEQARFVVLKSPDIPSILIETGFITNPREEKNLTDPHYQEKMARAIVSGLKRYFWEYPPRGTRLEFLTDETRVKAPKHQQRKRS
jgi:N-acetylmuramoyl-L-alanine amidase